MECTILSIGTELSLGLVQDTNSHFIADRLARLGIECNYMHIVRDNIDEICKILQLSISLSDIVIINGGLGPTDDDMTREAVAKSLGLDLVRDESLDSTSLKYIRKVKTKEVRKRLLKQSYIPKGAVSFAPRVGSASGFAINHKGKWIFSIPGVPREMSDMMNNNVVPMLSKMAGLDVEKNIKKIVIMTTDISETEIENRIKDLTLEAKSRNIRVGITANPGFIKVILVGPEARGEYIKDLAASMKEKIGSNVYGFDDARIGYHLKQAIKNNDQNITVSTAESITGGLIGSMITDIDGSSNYYCGGVVAYSNEAKCRILGVKEDTIEQKGAVSSEVCVQMARGSINLFDSHFGVAVTGYAGPEGKDIGLVYCAICGPQDACWVSEKRFIGTREDIKFRTAQYALNQLRIQVLESE